MPTIKTKNLLNKRNRELIYYIL